MFGTGDGVSLGDHKYDKDQLLFATTDII